MLSSIAKTAESSHVSSHSAHSSSEEHLEYLCWVNASTHPSKASSLIAVKVYLP